MTKIEIMNENKRLYAKVEAEIETLTGLEKEVTKEIILPWIKGKNWLGGMSDSAMNKAYNRVIEKGYSFEEICDEVSSQMGAII